MKRVQTVSLVMALAIAGATAMTGCAHRDPPPPKSGAFQISDKFFDADALGDGKFVLLGYQSKIVRTEDNGQTWKVLDRAAKRSLTRLAFVDGQKGYGIGHEGKISVTTDAATSWTEQDSGTKVSLFDLSFPTPQRGYAVGDQSTLVMTTDGSTWRSGKIEMSMIGVRADMSLAIEDPIFYSVHCLDENTCWVAGEFGQIRMTQDGGMTWDAQHESLLTGSMYRDIMALPTILCLRMKDRMNGVGVGTYGYVFITSDGGATWKMVQSVVKTPLYDIKFLENGDSVMVGSSGVVLIGNEASGWKRADVPPGVFSWISSLAIDGSGHGVAAGGHGLVLTTGDGGKSWQWKIG